MSSYTHRRVSKDIKGRDRDGLIVDGTCSVLRSAKEHTFAKKDDILAGSGVARRNVPMASADQRLSIGCALLLCYTRILVGRRCLDVGHPAF